MPKITSMGYKMKNLIKLFSLGMVMTGCVTRQPSYDEEGHCVGSEEEFSAWGQTWNTLSYGTLGIPYGAVRGVYESYNNTNETSVLLKTVELPYTAIKGMGQDCWNGLNYGYNLKYRTGRSVEGHVFDVIDHTTDYLFQQMNSLGH